MRLAACVLALACAALRSNAAGSAVAALNCGVGDCCYSRGKAQRFCACADAFQRSSALTVCSTVRCAGPGPAPGECERLLAVPPTRAVAAAQQHSARAPAPAVAAADCFCTLEYAPVCARGTTYGNACEVRASISCCIVNVDAAWAGALRRRAVQRRAGRVLSAAAFLGVSWARKRGGRSLCAAPASHSASVMAPAPHVASTQRHRRE